VDWSWSGVGVIENVLEQHWMNSSGYRMQISSLEWCWSITGDVGMHWRSTTQAILVIGWSLNGVGEIGNVLEHHWMDLLDTRCKRIHWTVVGAIYRSIMDVLLMWE
jgi:hypothetical protein